jgi:two-component system probable response regulator PhcQ
MEDLYDYKKFQILYVDDEEKSLKYFRETFGSKFSILTASNAEEGMRALWENQHQIAVLMTDQRMPGEKGIQLLERARQLNPRIIRILATAYSDLEAAIEAVNTGAIYKYVAKPWDVPQLEVTLKRGIEFFLIQRERDYLLQEKISALYSLVMTDRILSLGLLATGLSHHLRNPMAALKTFLEMAPADLTKEDLHLQGLRNPDFWKHYYEKVRSQMGRIEGLLKDLWESTEKPLAAFQDKVKPRQALKKALDLVGPELSRKGIQVEDILSSDLPELQVDGRKFDRLFELLLRDEAATLPEGGKLRFRAELAGPKGAPSEMRIEMEDEGPGLSKQALRSVFDPFLAPGEKVQDFGIHLMTCFFIVFHHGGKMTAKSSDGRGSLFTMTFPLGQQEQTAPPKEDLVTKVLLNETLWEKLISDE